MYTSREILPIGQAYPRTLDSSYTSALIYDVRSLVYVQFQVAASGAWPGSLVLTAQGCIGPSPNLWGGFNTAITATADGILKRIDVLGVDWLRLYVSTTGGSVTVEVRANGLSETSP